MPANSCTLLYMYVQCPDKSFWASRVTHPPIHSWTPQGVDFPHRVTLPYKVCRDAARAEFTQTSRSQEKAWPPWVAFLVLRLLLSPFRPHSPFILHPFFSNFIYSCYIFNCFTMTWSSTIKTHHYGHIDSEEELQVAVSMSASNAL